MNAMPQLDKLIEAIRQEANRPEYQLTGTHPLLATHKASSNTPSTTVVPADFGSHEVRAAVPVSASHVDDLLLISDNTQFIESAYLALLGRPADSYGSQAYTEKLTQGYGQPFVLAALRASTEGRSTNARLAGFGLSPLVYNVWRVGRRLGLETPARLLCNAYSAWRHLRLAASGRLAASLGSVSTRQDQFAASQSALARRQVESDQRLQQQASLADQLHGTLDAVTERTNGLMQQTVQFEQRTKVLAQSTEILSKQSSDLAASISQISVTQEHAQVRSSELAQRTNQQAEELAMQRERLQQANSLVDELRRAQFASDAKTSFELQILRARVLTLQQRLAGATSNERQALDPQKLLPTSEYSAIQSAPVGASKEEMDEYYLAFENAHRGSLEEITKKVTPYLHHVLQLPEQILGLPLVDLGCGRGEWMELLRDQGFEPRGVDVSPAMVQHCRSRGLKVEQDGAIQWLMQQPENSCALLTGFHIIEHIPFSERLALVKHALRVLAPGGALILETPNPESVLVGSHTFFHDYTHTQPVTPTSLQFLLGYHGFVELKVLRLNPYPSSDRVNDQSLLGERVNGHLYGPQDFSVIGYKP
jgi:2-polyprenyl-3-methyl-5-hydroxy-6-metoxy-1,4-benzoquinol methylase